MDALDGNAIGGLLEEVFGREMTIACGRLRALRRPGRGRRERRVPRRAGRRRPLPPLWKGADRDRTDSRNEMRRSDGARAADRSAAVTPSLPPLPLEGWEATKVTLRLWVQIVGKVRMADGRSEEPLVARHSLRRRPRPDDRPSAFAERGHGFQIDFDFVDHRLVVGARAEARSSRSRSLTGSPSRRSTRASTSACAGSGSTSRSGSRPTAWRRTTAFTRRTPSTRLTTATPSGASGGILDWTDSVLEEFSGWFCGKQSPVQLYWHSLDLAVTRFGGKRAPQGPEVDAVNREAYSHEVVWFGFWAGDENVREPAYYSIRPPSRRSARAAAPAGGGVLAGAQQRFARPAALRGGPDRLRPKTHTPDLPRERLRGRCRSRRLGSRRPRVVVVPDSGRARAADRGIDESGGMTGRQRLTLLAAILGSAVVTIDGTLVGVALPAIEEDLGGGLSARQWVSNAYLLTLVSLILVGGLVRPHRAPPLRLERSDDHRLPRRRALEAFRQVILICGLLVAAGGVIGAIGIVNPRRTVEAEQCPGGQLVGAPQPAVARRIARAP